MFYDSRFSIYSEAYSNQNIFADSLILESMWNNYDVTNRYNNGSGPVSQESFNNILHIEKRGGSSAR